MLGSWLSGYAAALLVMSVLDALWLGLLARGFYRQQVGDLMAAEVLKAPAAFFYLAYPAGLLALALHPLPASAGAAGARAALLGLVAYGTYDLTNLATLRGWSWKLTLVDMAWGALASAVAGTAAYLAMQRND
jgi:uncharacterized membrane protein